MRLTNRVILLAVAMLLAMLMLACGPAVPGTTATKPPATSGDEVTPSSATLPPAVASAVQKRLDSRHPLSHWTAAEGGYYLIETTFVPTGEHAYEWVSSDGRETASFGFMERADFAGVKDGAYRFLCSVVGDSFGVFPYYLAGKPGATPKEAPFYKVPSAETYGISSPGLAYELRKVGSTTSLDLLFMCTGPDPDGVMAGGGRPPAARIIESGHSVTMRFWYVSLAPGTEEAIRGFSSDAAKLKSVSCEDGCLELEFDVPWAYSVSLVGEKVEQKPGDLSQALDGYRISFLPKPAVLDAGTSFHDALTTATGLRFGDTTVTAPRLFGDLQEYLLRASPLQQVPAAASSGSGVDVALQVSGRWLEERGTFFAGGKYSPSFLKWRDRWYEVDPAFDALLKTASIPARDSMGETPNAVVGRYLIALYYRDWKAAYSCLGSVPADLTPQEFAKKAETLRSSGVHYRVEGYEMHQSGTASVSVSADRWKSREQPSTWKESWTCIRENGVWKLRWEPTSPTASAPSTAPVARPKSPFLVADLTGIPLRTEPSAAMQIRQRQTLSPGGSSLLLALQEHTMSGPRSESVAAYSFTDQWKHPTVFFSAGQDWAKDYNLVMPLGWVTDTSCLFLVGYRQVDGPHAGSQGISIRQGDLVTGKAEETGFIDRDSEVLHSAAFLKDRGRAYLHVSGVTSGAIWEYDVKSQSLRVVRDDLPVTSALFQPDLSSQGTWFVCGGGEPGKAGVYLIDAATGEETWLLPARDAFGFYPQWSPDGKWVSALTAGRKAGATGSGVDAYDVYPAEDGPAATARKLTVKSAVDGTTWVADAGGKLISWPFWSVDSKKVYFMAGEPGKVGIHGPDVSWDTLHSLDVGSGEVAEIANLVALSTQVQGPVRYIALIGGTERGVVLNIHISAGEPEERNDSVWYAGDTDPPRKIADGKWDVSFGVATCGDKMAGFVRDIRVGGDYSLWAVGPNGPEELATDILKTARPGEKFTALDLLTWDADRVFAVAYSYETGRSTVLGFVLPDDTATLPIEGVAEDGVSPEVSALFADYGWTASAFLGSAQATLPESLVTNVEDPPAKLYWMRAKALSDDIGYYLEDSLGKTVTIELYRVQGETPEGFASSVTRGVVLRGSDDRVVGAYIDTGRGAGASYTLSGRDLEDITGIAGYGVKDYWRDHYLDDSDPVNIAAAGRTAEEVIRRYFEGMTTGDVSMHLSTLSVDRKMDSLYVNLDDDLPFNDPPALYAYLDSVEILSIEPYDIEPYDTEYERENGLQGYEVRMNARVSERSVLEGGVHARFVTVGKEDGMLRIFGDGTGP